MAEFELMRDIMVFNASANKNDEDPIKHVGARVLTTLNIIFRHSKAANSATIHGIWSNLEIIQDLILVHVTKNDEDSIKKEASVLTTLNIIFFRMSRAANSAISGGIWSNIELIRDIMVVLVTCKSEKRFDSK